MRTGMILDNVQTALGETVPQSSIDKLAAMRATCVGTLWTGGTRHSREVYERCEAALDKPLYIVRVGGHRQTADEWLQDAAQAVMELPQSVDEEGRALLVVGNEPNLEGYKDDPTGYGKLYADIVAFQPFNQPLFACPSVGVDNWHTYLVTALANLPVNPKYMIANLYDYNTQQVAMLRTLCDHLLIGEVNTLRPNRVPWLIDTFAQLDIAGVEAATIFIAGGKSGGDWDERYIITHEEAIALGEHEEQTVFEWEMAFKTYAALNPERVGTPITGLMYDNQGNAWQYSDKGMLFSAKGEGWKIYWHPKA